MIDGIKKAVRIIFKKDSTESTSIIITNNDTTTELKVYPSRNLNSTNENLPAKSYAQNELQRKSKNKLLDDLEKLSSYSEIIPDASNITITSGDNSNRVKTFFSAFTVPAGTIIHINNSEGLEDMAIALPLQLLHAPFGGVIHNLPVASVTIPPKQEIAITTKEEISLCVPRDAKIEGAPKEADNLEVIESVLHNLIEVQMAQLLNTPQKNR